MLSLRLFALGGAALVIWVGALVVTLSLVDFSSRSRSLQEKERKNQDPPVTRYE